MTMERVVDGPRVVSYVATTAVSGGCTCQRPAMLTVRPPAKTVASPSHVSARAADSAAPPPACWMALSRIVRGSSGPVLGAAQATAHTKISMIRRMAENSSRRRDSQALDRYVHQMLTKSILLALAIAALFFPTASRAQGATVAGRAVDSTSRAPIGAI